MKFLNSFFKTYKRTGALIIVGIVAVIAIPASFLLTQNSFTPQSSTVNISTAVKLVNPPNLDQVGVQTDSILCNDDGFCYSAPDSSGQIEINPGSDQTYVPPASSGEQPNPDNPDDPHWTDVCSENAWICSVLSIPFKSIDDRKFEEEEEARKNEAERLEAERRANNSINTPQAPAKNNVSAPGTPDDEPLTPAQTAPSIEPIAATPQLPAATDKPAATAAPAQATAVPIAPPATKAPDPTRPAEAPGLSAGCESGIWDYAAGACAPGSGGGARVGEKFIPGFPQSRQSELPNCEVTDEEIAITASAREMFNKINQYRQQNGRAPLTLSRTLSQAAAWYSQDMDEKKSANHIDSLNRDLRARYNDCGYTKLGGENIGNTNAQQDIINKIFTGWQNSAGHNANMLDPEWVTVGIAESRIGDRSYWTTDFGDTSTGDWDGQSITTPKPGESEPTTTQIPTATNTPTSIPTVTPPPGQSPTGAAPTLPAGTTSLKMTVTIPGLGTNTNLGENPNPVSPVKPGAFQIINTGTQTTVANQTDVTFNYESPNKFVAQFPIPQVTPGRYQVKVKLDNSLWKNAGIVNIVANQTNNVPTVKLITGDLNQDNQVSIVDYNLLITCYSGSNKCTGTFIEINTDKSKSDLNLDGIIDDRDLNIFYTNLANREGD